MATTADISRGMILKLDGSLYSVVEFGQNKTARAAAKVWAKLKGVDNGRSIEHTWNSGDTVFPVRVEKKDYQFLYKDDSGYTFMDNETFEQVTLGESMVDAPQFLKEGQQVSVLFNTETEQPMSVELPDKIVVQVTYSEPGLRGDTATRTLKPATVETGATVNVPLFVNEGELIRINTKTGEYVERVK
jgi:elongation factor P